MNPNNSTKHSFRITALMPLRNFHPLFLDKAINSIMKQSFPNWHLLIIVEKWDFGKFLKLLENELNEPRIEIVINRGRKLAGAINTGMKNAKTEFVSLLLSDDMWSTDAIKTLHNYIQMYSEVDYFHSSRRYIDENDNPLSSIYHSRQVDSLDDFKNGTPVKHLMCWRREMALSIGGLDESLNSVGPDDFDFPWTMAEHGASFQVVKECLYLYRDHRESFRLTTHLPLSIHKREIERILKKHGADGNSIKERISYAEKSYLRQCLYKSTIDKWINETKGIDARKGKKQDYT